MNNRLIAFIVAATAMAAPLVAHSQQYDYAPGTVVTGVGSNGMTYSGVVNAPGAPVVMVAPDGSTSSYLPEPGLSPYAAPPY